MEKPSDTSIDILLKRIEELEHKFQSFEQTINDFRSPEAKLRPETPPQKSDLSSPQMRRESLPVNRGISVREPIEGTDALETSISKPEASAKKPEQAPVTAEIEPEAATSRIALETRIGSIWFNRLGLVALLIGFALSAKYIKIPDLESWHMALSIYFSAGLLFFCGWRFSKRLKKFTRPVKVGALSIAFLASFAAHFEESMACLPLWASLLLMLVSVGFIFLLAWRWHSELTAGLGIFLGHLAAFMARGDTYPLPLSIIAFLSLCALGLFWRLNWIFLCLFSLLAAAVSHFLWSVQDHAPFSPHFRFWISFLHLTSYYIIFLISDMIYRRRVFKRDVEFLTLKQRAAGRCLGPAALVLYAASAVSLFHVTEIYWGQIHFYFIPLAALQIFLVEYHRRQANADYALYSVAAILFATMGFFSLLMTAFLINHFALKAVWEGRLLSWWFITVMVGTGTALLALAFKRKRASFLWGGLITLSAAMMEIIHCLSASTVNSQPLILWMTTLAFFWIAAEALLRGFAKSRADYNDWRDHSGLKFLSGASRNISVGISIIATVFLILISYGYFDLRSMSNVHALLCRSILLYAGVFFIPAIILRSPSLYVAYALFLSAAHGIFQFHLGRSEMGAAMYPILSMSLLVASLLFGGITEYLLQHRGVVLTGSMRKWIVIGSWYPYVLSFLLCALAFQHYGLESISREGWDFLSTPSRFLPQMVMVLAAMILGRGFRLPRMQLAAFGYALLAIMNLMRWVSITPGYRVDLLPISIIVFLLIIAIERIITRQDPAVLESLNENLPKIMKYLLVVISAAFAVVVIPLSDIIRHYWTTVSLSFVALILMGLGFWWQERIYRKTALVLFAISVVRIVFIDIANLDLYYRMIAFFALGGCLVLVSILYSRFRTKIERWL